MGDFVVTCDATDIAEVAGQLRLASVSPPSVTRPLPPHLQSGQPGGLGEVEGQQPAYSDLAGLCHPAAAADGLFSVAGVAGHAVLGAIVQHFKLRGLARAWSRRRAAGDPRPHLGGG